MGLKLGRWDWGWNVDWRGLRIGIEENIWAQEGRGNGEWRKLHNEELNDLYSLPNLVRVIKSRRMRWAGHVARMGEGWGVYRVLVGKPERKRPLGRPRRRWEDNMLYSTHCQVFQSRASSMQQFRACHTSCLIFLIILCFITLNLLPASIDLWVSAFLRYWNWINTLTVLTGGTFFYRMPIKLTKLLKFSHYHFLLRITIVFVYVNVIFRWTFAFWASYTRQLRSVLALSRLLMFCHITYSTLGTAVAQWLRYCVTNQKVAGSITDGVIGFSFDINTSDRTMALGST
jgi:hypothetical protein